MASWPHVRHGFHSVRSSLPGLPLAHMLLSMDWRYGLHMELAVYRYAELIACTANCVRTAFLSYGVTVAPSALRMA